MSNLTTARRLCTGDQIIVSVDVTKDDNELYQLEPMLEQTKVRLQKSGIDQNVKVFAADAGYFRDDIDIEVIEKNGSELLICYQKNRKLRKKLKDKGCHKGRIPIVISKKIG